MICDSVIQAVDSFLIRECATRWYPDFFARVSLYVDWIRSVLRSAGGPRAALSLPFQTDAPGLRSDSKP